MYEIIPDDVMDEIIAGAGGTTEDQAGSAIAFLDQWSTWLAELIKIIKDFFAKFNTAE